MEPVLILSNNRSSVPVILFTSWDQEEILTDAPGYDPVFYLQKGGNPRTLFSQPGGNVREVCRWHEDEGA